MANMIRMDLFRLSRYKALRIALILLAALAFGAAGVSRGVLALVEMAVAAQPEMAEGLTFITLAVPFFQWTEGVDLGVVVMEYCGILTLAVACILSASFVNDEQVAGYSKNYMGQLRDKGMSVVSKLVATSVIHMLIILVCMLASAAAGMLFFGKYITGLHLGNLALTGFMRMLMYLSINAIIVFATLLTKSKTLPMILGVIFGIGASSVAYSVVTYGLQMLVSHVLGKPEVVVPAVSGLIPDGVERMIDGMFYTDPDGHLVFRVLIVAAIYIIGFAWLSCLVVRKRDVR